MTEKEFKDFLSSIGPFDEMLDIYLCCIEEPSRMDEMVKFIQDNKLDCKHLWEDSEEGHRAYEHYYIISRKQLEYDGIYLDEFAEKTASIINKKYKLK